MADLKITFTTGGSTYEFEGHAPYSEVQPLAAQFYATVVSLLDAEPGRVDRKLDQMQTQLAALAAQGDRMEQTAAQMKQALIDANAATDEIASDIAALKSKLEGGLTAEEAADVQGQLDALVAKSKAVAAEYTPDA